MSMSNHWRPSRASIAAGLVLVALATVALSEELFVTDARQPAAVLNVGGELLTGTDYGGVASVGEGLVPAGELRGGRMVMRPGFVPMWKASQPPPTSGVEPASAPELVNRLVGNHPNPFNPTTTIRFSLAEAGIASLKIYDVRGRLVRTLLEGPAQPGEHDLRWDGRSDGGARVASGVYFMRLAMAGFSEQRKLVLAR